MSDNKWKKSGDEKIEHVTDPLRSALSHAAYVKVASGEKPRIVDNKDGSFSVVDATGAVERTRFAPEE
jgi:hypothetical protein